MHNRGFGNTKSLYRAAAFVELIVLARMLLTRTMDAICSSLSSCEQIPPHRSRMNWPRSRQLLAAVLGEHYENDPLFSLTPLDESSFLHPRGSGIPASLKTCSSRFGSDAYHYLLSVDTTVK
jgi:hypothetical protein